MKTRRSVSRIVLYTVLFHLLFLTIAMPVSAGLYAQHASQRSLLTDGKLHIFLIGTGDPELEMQGVRKPSCLALLYKGQFMVFDAGEGSIQTIAGLGLPYEALTRAFITHWHSDHFAGLPQVINGSWVHGRKTPFLVYGPAGVEKTVSALNTAYELDAIYRADTLNGLIDTRLAKGVANEVAAQIDPVVVYSEGDLTVKAFAVDHRPVVPALGYLIEIRGRKIVVSGDTRVVDSLERNSQGADILISEALSHPLIEKEIAAQEKTGNLRMVKFYHGVQSYHADSLALAKMAQRSGVKRLVLTHLVPAIGTSNTAQKEFTSGMEEFFNGDLRIANDGDHMIIDVESADSLEVKYIEAKQIERELIRY